MGKGNSKTTIGYKYYLGVHMVLCHGPIDYIRRIRVDKRTAWEGISEGGTIEIDAEDLFGGEKSEGGVSGDVDIDMGYPDQIRNAYLQEQLGTDIPAFRGLVSAILNQTYVGNNPYLKNWSFRAERIMVRQDGLEQWYPEKAAIGCLNYQCDSYSNAVQEILEPEFYFPMQEGTGDESYDPRYPDEPEVVLEEVGNPMWEDLGDIEYMDSSLNIDQCTESFTRFTNDGHGVAFTPEPGDLIDLVGFGDDCTVGATVIFPTDTNSGALFSYALLTDPSNSGGSSWVIEIVNRNKLRYQTLPDAGEYKVRGDMVIDVDWGEVGVDSKPVNIAVYVGRTGLSVTLIIWANGVRVASGVITEDQSDELTGPISDNPQWRLDADHAGTATQRVIKMGGTSAIGDACLSSNTAHFWGMRGAPTDEQMAELQEAYLANFDSYIPPGCCDMNPAHIIREALTDPDWGLGHADSDIDDTSFMYAADTLYAEEMGISFLWDRQGPIEDFLSDMLRHIDAVLYVDRITGKFVLKLIRDDYSMSDLLVLDESNIEPDPETSRPTLGELTSSVTVVYADKETSENAAVTVHDGALAQVQSAAIATTVQYPGFTNHPLASRVAERDLRSLATPLLKAHKIVANREASGLNIGDPFIFTWPDDQIFTVVMRVQSIGYGDGLDNRITIAAVEDVFSLGDTTTSLIGQPDDLWEDPTEGEVAASSPRVATEIPYYVAVQIANQTAIDNILEDDPDSGFLIVGGGRQGGEFNADLLVDAGGGYEDVDTMDFCPYATLSTDAGITDTQLYYTGGVDLEVLEAGTILQIDDELVRYDGHNGTYFTVGRGILDTVPVEHSAGASFVFWGHSAGSDGVQYTASDELNVKIIPRLGTGVLPQASAPVDTVTMDSRAIRPYPPGDLRIGGESYPDAYVYVGGDVVSWKHRDRTQQTGGDILDHTDGHVGPENGVTYLVEGFNEDGSVWLSENVGGASSYTLPYLDSNGEPETDSNYTVIDSNFPAYVSGTFYVRVTAIRDGYTAWQSPVVRLQRLNTDRLLEDGTVRTLEDGTIRRLEG